MDTAELARLARAAGKRVAWPRISPTGVALEFACCDADELVPGPARALEPPRTAPSLPLDAIDLVVVPGVAFDAELPQARPRARPLRRHAGAGSGPARRAWGWPSTSRWSTSVPAEPHDVPLDVVVTGSRLLATRTRPG